MSIVTSVAKIRMSEDLSRANQTRRILLVYSDAVRLEYSIRSLFNFRHDTDYLRCAASACTCNVTSDL